MAGITPNGEPDYRKDVEKLVTKIARNAVGKVITRSITDTNKDLTIMPLLEWKGKGPKTCRALVVPENRFTAVPQGTGGKHGEPWYIGKSDDQDGITDNHDERYDTYDPSDVALGGGSNALLYFTPGEWPGCDHGPAILPDEVLLHEMVHALRIMQGLYYPTPTRDSNTSHHNEEEYLAIIVTNVYMRAKPKGSKLPLRANHFSSAELWKPLNTSKGFVDERDNQRVLSKHLNWSVFRELAKLKAANYNPFREHADRQAAPKKKPPNRPAVRTPGTRDAKRPK